MEFTGPVLEPGMTLTKVVDAVGPCFLQNCARKPKKQWFAASQPTNMQSEQPDFAEIEAQNERL